MDREQKKQNHHRRGCLKLKELSLLVCARGGDTDKAAVLKHVAAAAGQVSKTLWEQKRLYKDFFLDHFPACDLQDALRYFRIELRDEAILYCRQRIGRRQEEYTEYRRKYSGLTASRDLSITQQEATSLNLDMLVPKWTYRVAQWERMGEAKEKQLRRKQTTAGTKAWVEQTTKRRDEAMLNYVEGWSRQRIIDKFSITVRTFQRWLKRSLQSAFQAATFRFGQRLLRSKATAQSVFVRAKERFTKIVSVIRVPKASPLPGAGTNYGDEPAKNAEPSPKFAP